MRRGVEGREHRFYCKKRKNLLNYFKSIFDPNNQVKIILYNYSNTNNNIIFYNHLIKPYLKVWIFYDVGTFAKHNLISPRLATLYLTTNGKSFSK